MPQIYLLPKDLPCATLGLSSLLSQEGSSPAEALPKPLPAVPGFSLETSQVDAGLS